MTNRPEWKEFIEGTLIEALDIELVELGESKVVLTMPVGPKTRQPMGLLHGGASVALAETAASIGAYFKVAPMGKGTVGLEINANHIRSKKDGIVTAIATVLHEGRTTMVWNIEIVDEEGNLLCISRCTMAIIGAK
ncbi:hotdog fold thioesterase [Baia soyae]|uniref:Uncharacterized protein (TIGR00369 family) n=1 Tax=Baia soyae TaxID=1544746 RepID=A0A4R2RGR5_9BACL|nr:hotdog fold thioesterase [Baia soyae]TCP61768.1 uncharacterized protein (TIGR00369 family) [Baia soyae]